MKTLNIKHVSAISLVSVLFTAIDNHQLAVDGTHSTYIARDSALKALRDAGYTCVQDGRSKIACAAHEVSNDSVLAAFFNERFINKAITKNILASEYSLANGGAAIEYISPTDVQIATNLKHQISFLTHYLKTGVFTTHIGREKTRSEEFETSKIIAAAESKAKADLAKAEKTKQALLTLANKAAREKNAREARLLLEAQKAEQAAEQAATVALLTEQLAADREAELSKAKPNKAKLTALAKTEEAHIKELIARQEEADRVARQAASDKIQAAAAAALLAQEVLQAASDKIQADATAAKSLADAKKLIAAAAKKKVAKKPALSEDQIIKNILASCKNSLSKDGLEKLLDGLTDLIELLD